MTLREEIDHQFETAKDRIRTKQTPAGVAPVEGGPDLRWVTVNENNAAIVESLRLIAERIDRLESGSTSLH